MLNIKRRCGKLLIKFFAFFVCKTSSDRRQFFNADNVETWLKSEVSNFYRFFLQQNGSSILTLPPRPKVSRSFSFSDSRREAGDSRGRSQSVYGLQSPALSWIDSLGASPSSSSPCPNCSESVLYLMPYSSPPSQSDPKTIDPFMDLKTMHTDSTPLLTAQYFRFPGPVLVLRPPAHFQVTQPRQPPAQRGQAAVLLPEGPQHGAAQQARACHGLHLEQGEVRELQEHQGPRGQRQFRFR